MGVRFQTLGTKSKHDVIQTASISKDRPTDPTPNCMTSVTSVRDILHGKMKRDWRSLSASRFDGVVRKSLKVVGEWRYVMSLLCAFHPLASGRTKARKCHWGS